MRNRLLILACINALPLLSDAMLSESKHEVKVRNNVRVPMRDGITLAADIYLPVEPGKYPGLLLLTPYSKLRESYVEQAAYFAKRGYGVALVDSRGRHDSGGVWEPYVNEPRDGYDAQQWLGQQPWSTGKIGMFGTSYVGFTQLMPAPFRSPYVKALVPAVNQQSNFGHIYNDGVMQLNMVFTFGLFCSGRTMQFTTPNGIESNPLFNYDEIFRRLPLISAMDDIADLPHIKTWMKHPTYDEYWKSYGIKEKYGEIDVPAYFLSGWYDNLVHEAWRNFKGFREQGRSEQARKGTKILIGPWTHSLARKERPDWAVDFGPDINTNLVDLHVRWYDYWLKGMKNGIDQQAPIRIFVMGANQWRDEQEWPLARAKLTPFYLHSGGKANSLYGDGSLGTATPPKTGVVDSFVYDPANPVPTLGGQISTHADLRGPRDRRAVQRRDDVLVYTSAPLSRDMEVTGPVDVKLYAMSSAVDTDFTATLTDVHPDGRAVHICEGIRRASFRESLENPTAIEPGKVHQYTISLWETSNVFKAGHRIRLEISSSNFPRYARNQNTGHPFGMDAEIQTAKQTILHDESRPSQLILPVNPQ